MELLYIWINKGKNIIQQGYDFSMEFRFDMIYENRKMILVSTEKKSYSTHFFDEDGIITNITAIVGKNGAGKTSLLQELCKLECYPKFEEEREEYIGFEQEEYEKNKKLLVVRKEKEIVIYHNFLPDEFTNSTSHRVIELYSNTEVSQRIYSESSDFKDITTVYLTNSAYNYGQNGISMDGKLSEIILTPDALSVIAGSYYKRLLHLESDDLQNNILAFFNTKVVKEQRKLKNFQQICDILYFHILYEHNLLEEYSGVVTTRLDVSFSSCIRMLEQVYTDFHDGGNDKDFSERKKYFYKKYAEFNQYVKIFNNALLKDIIATNKLNLLFECIITFDLPLESYKDKDTFRKITNYIMMIVSKQEDGGIKKYFLSGINEIKDLERLKKELIRYENNVPLEDLAYRSDMVLDRSIAEKTYAEFLNLIKKYYDNEYSFILKYMEIGNLEMSSGERAFQNFFSWLNLIPTFNKIDNKVPERLHDTILLLIDEIDLYLHPEWQRNIIYNIMKEIKRQFSTYKVQIIFATHSPLVLSDLPRENTIYLSLEDRRSIPDKIDNHRQTFGADIYTLLNDAFYLKEGSMGKFATIKINNIIKRLETSSDNHSILSDDEVLRLNDEILGIGNELIKKKLLIMLDKCSKEVSKIHRINLLEKRKELLEKEIRELTSGVIE